MRLSVAVCGFGGVGVVVVALVQISVKTGRKGWMGLGLCQGVGV